MTDKPDVPNLPVMAMAEFLETQLPGVTVNVPDFHVLAEGNWVTNQPVLHMHCDSEVCNGKRMFRATSKLPLIEKKGSEFSLYMFVATATENGRSLHSLHAIQ